MPLQASLENVTLFPTQECDYAANAALHSQKKKKNKKKAQGVESAVFGTMSAFGCIDNVA